MTTLTRPQSCSGKHASASRLTQRALQQEATLEESTIAELNAAAIERMTHDELIRVIRDAVLPDRMRCEMDGRLAFYDLDMLRQLTYLARKCCQTRIFTAARDKCDF